MKHLFCVIAGMACECGAATIYVSPTGNDGWSGRSAGIEAKGAGDGPLATLDGARRCLRLLRAKGALTTNETARVVFAAGEYPLAAAVEFAPEDSFVTYEAAPGAAVTFVGGRSLGTFTEGAGGLWQMPIPEGPAFEQLYVNGRRAQRAKSPNEFYFYMREPVAYGRDPVTGRAEADLTRRAFITDPENLKGLEGLSADQLSNVVLRVYNSWEANQSRLQQVDRKNGLVVGTASSPRPYFYWQLYQPRFVLENYRAALDSPGEWYADFKAGMLFYLPLPAEKTLGTSSVAPVTESFLLFKGDARAGRWVRGIRFNRLRFRYTAYHLPPEGQRGIQADVIESAAVMADGASGLVFHDCEFTHVGSHAIYLRRGCRDCEVSHCLITDLGGGAVYVGGSEWSPEEVPALLTGRIRVDDNILQDGGHAFPGSVGVWIGHASEVSVTHNDVGDFFYSGISMGWTWGYGPTATRNNVLAFNHVHHIGEGVLSDLGGIYTLGDLAGSVISNNCVHDVYSYDYTGQGAFGFYADEGSSGLVLENNLFYRAKTGGINQHYGKGNVFRNNIIALNLEGQIERFRIEGHTTIIVTNNIIYWDNESPAVYRGPNGPKGAASVGDMFFDRNIYWNPKGMPGHAFQNRSWEQWRKDGQDAHSLWADPQFVNPDGKDFRLKLSSPARAAGFRPVDVSAIGVYGDEGWKKLARQDSPPLRRAPVPEPFTLKHFETGFEEIPVGKMSIPVISVYRHEKDEFIRVTDRQAFLGKKSLQILHAAGKKDFGQPLFFLRFAHTNGWIENRFAIRLDKGASLFTEWRDNRSDAVKSYCRGISLHIAPGALVASGRVKKANGETVNVSETVADLPVDTWMKITVRCLLGGSQPDGAPWTLHVEIPGRPEVSRSYLAIDRGFKLVDWLGFVSDTKDNASFYLDAFSYGLGGSADAGRAAPNAM